MADVFAAGVYLKTAEKVAFVPVLCAEPIVAAGTSTITAQIETVKRRNMSLTPLAR
jgi:hypothetical protein